MRVRLDTSAETDTMTTTFLLSELSDYDCTTIFHVSDIHIRLLSRREEYCYVFERLYQTIGAHPCRSSAMIVVTGDVLHNKMELSPECILMAFEFFRRLADLCPTIVIAGNHDALVHNLDRVDSLTSILQGRDIPRCFYLKQTGYYAIGSDLVFGVRSLIDKDKRTLASPSSYSFSRPKRWVGLFHGSMEGWRNACGFEMRESFETTVSEWRGFDRGDGCGARGSGMESARSVLSLHSFG
ncbi:MAG: hypothetical protein EBX52_12455 [Proteobacteria bacterium]|nr:hypothetical protein [Pseudomonadota bacterium]